MWLKFENISAGNPDDDLWFLQAAARYTQALLALPHFISQLWCLGNSGTSVNLLIHSDSFLRRKICLSENKMFFRKEKSLVPLFFEIQGAYKNDFIGLEFEPLIPGSPKLKGEEVIRTIFGVTVTRSKWWDLSAIVLILVCYRVLFFIILKFKERASPLFQNLYAKKSLQQLRERPSFRSPPSFSSKRHQTPHSLSSQEGLNSPLN